MKSISKRILSIAIPFLLLFIGCRNTQPVKLKITFLKPDEIILLEVKKENTRIQADSILIDFLSTTHSFTIPSTGTVEIKYTDCFRKQHKIALDLDPHTVYKVPEQKFIRVTADHLLADSKSDTLQLFMRNILPDSAQDFNTHILRYSVRLVKMSQGLAVNTIRYSKSMTYADTVYKAILPLSYADSLFTALRNTESEKSDEHVLVCGFGYEGELHWQLCSGNSSTREVKVIWLHPLYEVMMRLTGECDGKANTQNE